jgi:hypothetical protein
VLAAPSIRLRGPVRSWWRRADVLVAASVLLLLLPLVPPGLNRLRHQHGILACQNNLLGFYHALMTYSDMHDGALPKVEEQPPRHVAGIFVPILHDESLLGKNVSVDCPANGFRPPPNVSLQDLERDLEAGEHQFMRRARDLAGCYAYSLGYRDSEKRLCGLRFDAEQPNNDFLPIMADCPPFNQTNYSLATAANSRNHDQAGQNVLYLSGRIAFSKNRLVGVNGNDIYLNKNKRPEAGIDRWDSVLGASGFHPSLSLISGD